MAPTRVGIIGGGTCGPVMAMCLKLKGYEPVIYERASEVMGRGLSLLYAFLQFARLRSPLMSVQDAA